MRKAKFITIAAAGVLMLWGCDVKDPIYETDQPDKAKITVTTDWSGMGAGITKPTTYKAAYGSEILTATTDRYTFPTPFTPGSHTIYFYNDVTAIPVTGKTATVKTVADGTLEPGPDWLFTGKLTAELEKGKHHEFTVPMAQQVRELTLFIEPAGGTADKIKTITGILSGVAGSYDMESGAHGTPSDVAMTFTKQTSGDYAGNWTATVRLLGITGNEQKLTGTIAFTDGTPGDMPLDSDLSTYIAKFNDEKNKPFVLVGPVVETPSPTGFTATINGWKPITGNGVIAD